MPVTIDPQMKEAIEELTLEMLAEALAAQPPNEPAQYRADGTPIYRAPVVKHRQPRQKFSQPRKPQRRVYTLPQPHTEHFADLVKHVAFGRKFNYHAARELVVTGQLSEDEREYGAALGDLHRLTTVQKYQSEQIAPLAFDSGVSRVAEAQRIVAEARKEGRKADYVKVLKGLGGAQN